MGQVRHSGTVLTHRHCHRPTTLCAAHYPRRGDREPAGGHGAGAETPVRRCPGSPGKALMLEPRHPSSPTARAAGARPLVMRCGAFGDIVLLTVLLRQLHQRFGKPVDVISSGPWTPPLLEGEGAVGHLYMIRSRRTPYWLSVQQRRLVRWLRERGAGPTWFCDRGEGRGLLTRGGIPDDYICDTNAYKWIPGETFTDRYLRLGSYTPKAFEGLLPEAKPGVPSAARL